MNIKWKPTTIVLNKRPLTRKLAVTLIQLVIFVSGCMSPEETGAQADAPAILYPAARDLLEATPEDVIVRAERATGDSALTTTLIRKVAEEARDVVLRIYVKSQTPYRLKMLPFSPFGGIPVRVPGLGLGSGFFIHPSGYIMTNNHVIQDAEQIRILTSSGKDFDVVVVARDRAYDLALLKVRASSLQKFRVLPMGDSDAIDAGDMVIAVGNPLGLGHTVTSGIISQTYRNITRDLSEDGRHVDSIQTDAAINPG